MKKKIAVIYGGEGKEHSISIRSAKGVLPLIDKEKYEILEVFISKDGRWLLKTKTGDIPTFPVRLGSASGLLSGDSVTEVYCAIPVLHGDFGEDGRVQGLLDAAHIKYVGCKTLAGAVASDKITAKAVAEHLNIPTAKWTWGKGMCDLEKAKRTAEGSFGYPMFVKPSGLGSSVGASKVICAEDFDEAYAVAACAGDGRVLVEEYVCSDYELECGYFCSGEPRVTASGRICSLGEFYDYRKKYECSEHIAVHGCRSNESISRQAEDFAIKLCAFLDVNHLSRIDFFVKGEEIYFNEINTFPGMTEGSLYPLLCEDMGINKEKFINLLIEDAANS